MTLSAPAFRRATSPEGRGKGAAAPAQLTKINDHLRESLCRCRIIACILRSPQKPAARKWAAGEIQPR